MWCTNKIRIITVNQLFADFLFKNLYDKLRKGN